MKKIALIFAVAGMIGLTSCSKDGGDVECTFSVFGIETEVTVTETEVETCALGICDTETLASLGTTQDDYVSTLESTGFKCK